MKIKLTTLVTTPYETVTQHFTRELFTAINPPFPPVKVTRFDGSKRGDYIALELNFILFKQTWISHIIEDSKDNNRFSFIDTGEKLPFFLKSWRHNHVVEKEGAQSLITDDIEFSSGNIVLDILLYPAMYLQFLYRKPAYRRYFSKVSAS